MTTRSRAKSDDTLSVDISILGSTTQLKALAKRLSLSAGAVGAGLAKGTPSTRSLPCGSNVSTEIVLQALHPAPPELWSELQSGKVPKKTQELLRQHWGGWPLTDFPTTTLWEINEQEISVEIPASGELAPTLVALSAGLPGLAVTCAYTYFDTEAGEKDFDRPIRIARARYRNGLLERAQEWRA